MASIFLGFSIVLAAALMGNRRDRRRSTRKRLTALTQDVTQCVRRHRPRGGFWPSVIDGSTATGMLSQITGYMGRRDADNPHRDIVPADWSPLIGRARIAVLCTETSEYVMIRTPMDPGTHFVRGSV